MNASIARFTAAGFAIVTPTLLARLAAGHVRRLGVAVAIGLATAWTTFGHRTRNEFDVEGLDNLDHDDNPDVVDGTARPAVA